LSVVIAHERRILDEDVATFRVLDVRFEADQAVLARLLEDLVEYLQQFGVRLRTVGVGLEQSQGLPNARLQHRRRIRDDQRADGRSTEDEKLVELHEHHQLAVVHEIATDHGSKNDDQANDDEHAGDPV
jgi:hypothetical protein